MTYYHPTVLMGCLGKYASAGADPFGAGYANQPIAAPTPPPGSIEAKKQQETDSASAEAEAAAKAEQEKGKQLEQQMKGVQGQYEKSLQENQKIQGELAQIKAKADAYEARDAVSSPGLGPALEGQRKRMDSSVKKLTSNASKYNGALTISKAARYSMKHARLEKVAELSKRDQVFALIKMAAPNMNPDSTSMAKPKRISGQQLWDGKKTKDPFNGIRGKLEANPNYAARNPTINERMGTGGFGMGTGGFGNRQNPEMHKALTQGNGQKMTRQDKIDATRMDTGGVQTPSWGPPNAEGVMELPADVPARQKLNRGINRGAQGVSDFLPGAGSFDPLNPPPPSTKLKDGLTGINDYYRPQLDKVRDAANNTGSFDLQGQRPTPWDDRFTSAGQMQNSPGMGDRYGFGGQTSGMSNAQQAQYDHLVNNETPKDIMGKQDGMLRNMGDSFNSYIEDPQEWAKEHGGVMGDGFFKGLAKKHIGENPYEAGTIGHGLKEFGAKQLNRMAGVADAVKHPVTHWGNEGGAGIAQGFRGFYDSLKGFKDTADNLGEFGKGVAGKARKGDWKGILDTKTDDLLESTEQGRERFAEGVKDIKGGALGVADGLTMGAPSAIAEFFGGSKQPPKSPPTQIAQQPQQPNPLPTGPPPIPGGTLTGFQGAYGNSGFAQNLNHPYGSGYRNAQYFPGQVPNIYNPNQGLLSTILSQFGPAFTGPNYGNTMQGQQAFRNAGTRWAPMQDAMQAFTGRNGAAPIRFGQHNNPSYLSQYNG